MSPKQYYNPNTPTLFNFYPVNVVSFVRSIPDHLWHYFWCIFFNLEQFSLSLSIKALIFWRVLDISQMFLISSLANTSLWINSDYTYFIQLSQEVITCASQYATYPEAHAVGLSHWLTHSVTVDHLVKMALPGFFPVKLPFPV